MAIEGIIFDFGGVIMRTMDRNPRSALANRFNVSVDTIENLVFSSPSAKLAELGKISAHQHWQNVARALEASEEEIPTIRQQFFAGDRMDWNLLDYIQSLRQQYRVALLSNAFDDLRLELTGKSSPTSAYHISVSDHFLDYFDEIIISAEIGIAKPDHRIFQYVSTKLNIPLDKNVFIDDFPMNVEGALMAGMHAIRFENILQFQQDLAALLNNSYPEKKD